MKVLKDYAVNETNDSFVLIQHAEKRIDKKGNAYLSLVFQDKTMWMKAQLWHLTAEDEAMYQSGKVVYIKGKREVFQGQPQMRILSMRLATKEEPYQPELYQSQQTLSATTMEEQLQQAIAAIDYTPWRNIVQHIVDQHQSAIYQAPAAKSFHHTFKGGLMSHTLSLLQLAHGYVQHYPMINKDLLIAGIILHDIAKVEEFHLEDGQTTYTLAGNLCGHIVMMDEWIDRVAMQLGYGTEQEDIIVLKHMVLAHHGKKEYGSPVEPRLLEAEVLHQIDHNDATIQMISQSLQHTEVGQYTLPIVGCDNRSFYRYK